MKFVFECELGNDEMQDQHDVAGALEKVAQRLRRSVSARFGPYTLEGKVMDRNGNTVGKWEVLP